MALNITNLCSQRKIKTFGAKEWATLRHKLGIVPLGLNPSEIQVLRVLGNSKDCSLTNIAAKTGISKQAVQRDFEIYLQKHSLMEITTAGRNITAKGLDYLKLLDGNDYSTPAEINNTSIPPIYSRI